MNRVHIFFYGTFMSPLALQDFGVTVQTVLPARISGFRLYIRPRVNLLREDRSFVYGSVAALTHREIQHLYSSLEQRFDLKYLPEPVLAESHDRGFFPALCYIAPEMKDAPADKAYVAELAACVRALGHPESYAEYIETFAD